MCIWSGCTSSKKAQSTCPVVNHAQESISIGNWYNWCFLRVKRRILLFWLSMLSKTLPWKLIIFIYIFFTLFFGFFIHSLGTGNRSWVCSQIWFAKKKVPTNHKNSSTMTLIYSSTLMSNPLDSRKTKLLKIKTVDFSIRSKLFSSNYFKKSQNNNIIFIKKSKK